MAQEGAGVAPRVSTAGPRKGSCPLFLLLFFLHATPEHQKEVAYVSNSHPLAPPVENEKHYKKQTVFLKNHVFYVAEFVSLLA